MAGWVRNPDVIELADSVTDSDADGSAARQAERTRLVALALDAVMPWGNTRRAPALVGAVVDAVLADQAGRPGPIEAQVRADVAALGRLTGARASYAALAYRLARSLDVEDGEGSVAVAGAARELRAVLEEIWKGVRSGKRSDGFVADLDKPVPGRPAVPAEVPHSP